MLDDGKGHDIEITSERIAMIRELAAALSGEASKELADFITKTEVEMVQNEGKTFSEFWNALVKQD